MQLEWHQLRLKYEALRIDDPARQARLVASIATMGQQSAVIVVKADDGYVLVDGYSRVRALREMGRDAVWAVELPMDELSALVMCHRLLSARRRTAIEDGWFVRELMDGHGMSQAEASRRIGRSTSWVSRRLALVRVLPLEVQDHVRSGRLCPYAAMRYLVPLARANAPQCRMIADAIAGHGLSARQVARIHMAWKRAEPLVRERIAASPMLCLSSDEEIRRPDTPDPLDAFVRDIEAVGGLSRRATRKLREGLPLADGVKDAWTATEGSFERLRDHMKERLDAGS